MRNVFSLRARQTLMNYQYVKYDACLGMKKSCHFLLQLINFYFFDFFFMFPRKTTLREGSEFISCSFMFWSVEAMVGRKIDLSCNGVFAIWFLIINAKWQLQRKPCSLILKGCNPDVCHWCFVLKKCFCCCHTRNISVWGHIVYF